MAGYTKPKSIPIFGYDHEIEYKRNEDHGNYNLDDLKITIDDECKDLNATLLHEVIHGIIQLSGQAYLMSDEQQEAITRMMEHGLAPIATLNCLKRKPDGKARHRPIKDD